MAGGQINFFDSGGVEVGEKVRGYDVGGWRDCPRRASLRLGADQIRASDFCVSSRKHFDDRLHSADIRQLKDE